MRKRLILLWTLICISSFVLTGCTIGDEMIPLTEEEQSTIASYCAHIVSKYNSKSKYGLVNPSPQEEEEEEEETSSSDVEEQAQTDADSSSDESDSSETDDSGDGSESSSTGDESQDEETAVAAMSMTEAMGIDGVSFEYKGYDVASTLSEGSYFSIDAADGYKYLKLKFKMKASKDASINVMGLDPRFRVVINEDETYVSQATLLLSDLSTFDEKIKSGESRNVFLVFEIDKSVAKSIEGILLTVTIDDKAGEVALQ